MITTQSEHTPHGSSFAARVVCDRCCLHGPWINLATSVYDVRSTLKYLGVYPDWSEYTDGRMLRDACPACTRTPALERTRG